MDCITAVRELLAKEGLPDSAAIPMAACRIIKPYLLEKNGLTQNRGTVVFALIPYRTPACDDKNKNVSAYAVSRDYHLFWQQTADRILPLLRESYPERTFAAFADHSPFAEVDAAAKAGLGVVGTNGLLLTEKYSSFVFIGSIVIDVESNDVGTIPACAPHCENCGACKRACPARTGGTCLSAVTQQKTEPTSAEWDAILCTGILWGCDVCQDVCPYTEKAKEAGTIYTKIPFFYNNTISRLTCAYVQNATDAELKERAWSWRGRDVILRNLKRAETQDEQKGPSTC